MVNGMDVNEFEKLIDAILDGNQNLEAAFMLEYHTIANAAARSGEAIAYARHLKTVGADRVSF